MNKAEELIACLEGEIAKRDEELAACRVAVENCEVFRARIAELEDDLKCAHSMLCEVSKSGMVLRAELSAIKAQEPLTVEFMQFMTAVVTGAGLLSRGKQSKGLASELSATAYKYMLGAQVSGYQQKPIGYRCWFNKEPKNIMFEWGKSLPSDMNPSATYQELYAAPVSEAKAQGDYAPDSVVWIDAHHVIEGNNPSFIKDVALVSAERTSETQIPLVRLNAAPVQQVSAPDGWKLVPVEPTREMISAAGGAITTPDDLPPVGAGGWSMNDLAFRSRYRDAIAAAPAAPAADAGHVFYGMDGNHP